MTALTKERKAALLRRSLGAPEIDRRDKSEQVFRCPWCRHPKPKLSVNLETDWYNCWTCPQKKTSGGTLTKLLLRGCSREEVSEYLESIASERTRCVSVDVQPTHVDMPDEFESITTVDGGFPYTPYLNYLRSRGVTREDAAFHRLGLCHTGRYEGRVVFPSFDADGELNFLTGRTVRAKGFPTYLTCDSSKDIVFNECLVDWSRPISIVEGPFDMLAAGRNAIPLQGKMLRPSSRLFERLVRSGTRVNIALDTDAWHDQVSITHMLYRYCVDVWIVRCVGFKDVSDMGRTEFTRRLDRAERYHPRNRFTLLCE